MGEVTAYLLSFYPLYLELFSEYGAAVGHPAYRLPSTTYRNSSLNWAYFSAIHP